MGALDLRVRAVKHKPQNTDVRWRLLLVPARLNRRFAKCTTGSVGTGSQPSALSTAELFTQGAWRGGRPKQQRSMR